MERQRFLALRHETCSLLCSDSMSQSNYRPPFYGTMVVTTFLRCPQNELQQSVSNIRACILENTCAELYYYTRIVLSAAFQGKNTCNNIGTMSYK